MKHIKYILSISIILPAFFSFTFGQSTSFQLPTSITTSSFDIINSLGWSLLKMRADGRLGINQPNPIAGLHIFSDDGLLAQGNTSMGITLNLGAGTRMHWYSRRTAFRVGGVDGTQWDDANIGFFSFASGYNTIASNWYSTAMGFKTTASNWYSTAIGNSTTASGKYSTAIGNSTIANGKYSFALGNYVSTNTKQGAFIIGDLSSFAITNNTANDQMMMRFVGGYILYTNSGLSAGAVLSAGGSSWGTVSDSTKKENFKGVNGEYFLNSISKLRLGSWNYKTQDPKKFRHYGPMAQEIYNYFGSDGVGVIGVDTLLASADMDGIEMIALQALVKRTDELKIAQYKLENKTAELVKLKDTLKELQKDFRQIKKAFAIFINNGIPKVKSKLTMNK